MNTKLIVMGAALVVGVVALGFIRVTEETYQHIRIWGHALAGLAMGGGISLIIMGCLSRPTLSE